MRSSITQCFTRTMIEQVLDLLNGYMAEVHALWKILAQESIGLFIQSAFPCMIGMGKEHIQSQLTGQSLMTCKFLAVIHCQCFQRSLKFVAHDQDIPVYRLCLSITNFIYKRVFRLALYHCQQACLMIFSKNRVTFPVAISAFGGHNIRTFINPAPIRYLPALVRTGETFSALSPTPTQLPKKR